MAFLLALGAVCEEEREILASGDFDYAVLADGTAEIVKYRGDAAELTVPDAIDGYSVSSIGDEAFYYSSIKAVTIPDSIIQVGANPFVECSSLKSITVSQDHPTLEVIDNVLFDKTEKKLICLPNGLKSQSYIVPDGTLIIGASAFSFCTNLSEMVIPDGVSFIGEKAFSRCKKLTVIASEDSYAAEYANQNNISYKHP